MIKLGDYKVYPTIFPDKSSQIWKLPEEVYLYTTHGIYSKGTKILFDNGIDRIFNRKGEVHG